MSRFKSLTLAALLGMPYSAIADGHTSGNAEEIFLPENAILDTSIPFAIGAREAQQELRGSYGWDTFQEGLVEGVYFRFDPDGYARFSPTARLDADLFEVLCRPRTLNCVARKGPLSLTINGQGLLQMSIEGVAPGDQFFIADQQDEIEVPDRILQPLDSRFENVLSVGGDLIVRRGQNETQRISLIGFSAVTSYLRWILAEQDYLALPRNWPVPNGNTSLASPSLTAPDAWRNVAVGAGAPQIETASLAPSSTNDETLTQLASLRALVEQITNEPTKDANVGGMVLSSDNNTHAQYGSHSDSGMQMVLMRLDILERDVSNIKSTMHTSDEMPASNKPAGMSDMSTAQHEAGVTTDLVEIASQIQQLTEQFGVDPAVAALLLRLQNEQLANSEIWDNERVNILLNATGSDLDIASMTADLSAEINGHSTVQRLDDLAGENNYVLLTDYFKSVSETPSVTE